MPEFEGYDRGYDSSKQRGKKGTVNCGFCGRKVPRQKTFITHRGFRITDPTILNAVEDKRQIHTQTHKVYACPKCARFYGIVEKKGQRQRRRS